MTWVLGLSVPGASFGTTGKLYLARPTTGAFGKRREMTLPTGTTGIDQPGSSCIFDGRFYGVGAWSNNIVIDSHYRVHAQGIRAPSAVPTLTTAAGPGITGACVVYVRFRDSITGEVSPLSGASASVNFANQERVIGNIQATSNDPRVDQVQVLVSVNGALARVSTTRDLGVTAVTESTATLALGEAAPDTFEPMKFGTINAIFHQRQCVAGNPQYPDTLFVSAYGYGERYEGLSFKTEKGEPIVGLANVDAGDMLLVFTPINCYYLRGYTSADLVFKPLNGGVGTICHAGLVDVDGVLWIPSEKSFYVYNGAFHNVGRDIETFWGEFYKAHETECRKGFAFHNPEDRTYSFVPNFASAYNDIPLAIPDPDDALVTLALVADYAAVAPSDTGVMIPAAWSFDGWGKRITAGNALAYPGGRRRQAYLGTLGLLFFYVDPTASASSTLDPFKARLWIRCPHYVYGDPGGATSEGKQLVELWTYVLAESVNWSVYCKGGDDEAWENATPDNTTFFWKDDVAASEQVDYYDTYWSWRAKLATHHHRPQLVSGHGHTMEYTCTFPPSAFHWRGLGGRWLDAARATRGTMRQSPPEG